MKVTKVFSNFYRKDLIKLYHNAIPKGFKKGFYPNLRKSTKYDYIVLPFTVTSSPDIELLIEDLKKYTHENTRIVVVNFNFLWKPILDIASKAGIRKRINYEPNWFNTDDIENVFNIEGYHQVKILRRFLFPLPLGFISSFINSYIAQLPLINILCLTTVQIFRPVKPKKEYSVSIIIPARNEAGHMKGVLKKIPILGSKTEIIFVEGNSTDDTYDVIKHEVFKHINSKYNPVLFKQKGKGKADAVRLGFDKAKGDILMILDADLTVAPQDLKKFYKALSSGFCDFANGSRLVYPMEHQAMRTLNYFGNKIFSFAFSYILNQKIKDTLCGTKVLFKKDYKLIKKNRKYFGDFDPFGDFDLLFGATRINLKISDIPIRYKERVYGTTNIKRFTHGMLLARMTVIGAKKLKFK